MSKLTEIIFAGKYHYLTSGFGWRRYMINGKWVTDFHQGADYGTNGVNLPLYILEDDGYVYSSGYDSSAGNYLWVWYDRLNVRMAYFHMKSPTVLSKGQRIKVGQLAGYTGTTGNSNGIHLHLGIRDSRGNYIDPEVYAKTYSAPSGGGGEEDDEMTKFKIFKALQTQVSSQQVVEGVIAMKGSDGVLRGYNMNGDARMVREFTEVTKSQIFESMKSELQPNELIAAFDD